MYTPKKFLFVILTLFCCTLSTHASGGNKDHRCQIAIEKMIVEDSFINEKYDLHIIKEETACLADNICHGLSESECYFKIWNIECSDPSDKGRPFFPLYIKFISSEMDPWHYLEILFDCDSPETLKECKKLNHYDGDEEIIDCRGPEPEDTRPRECKPYIAVLYNIMHSDIIMEKTFVACRDFDVDDKIDNIVEMINKGGIVKKEYMEETILKIFSNDGLIKVVFLEDQKKEAKNKDDRKISRE